MKHEEKRKSLYVATHDYTSLTKVGVAVNPTARLTQLKTQAGAELQLYYESPLIENFLKVEAEVLEYFKDKRICGEWINETPKKIIEFINTLNFDSEEYTCLSCVFEEYTGESIDSKQRYYLTDDVPQAKLLNEIKEGLYISDDYQFFVFIQQSKFIYQIRFNIYRTANKFLYEYKDRAVKIDKETNKFIKNPKFRIENE